MLFNIPQRLAAVALLSSFLLPSHATLAQRPAEAGTPGGYQDWRFQVWGDVDSAVGDLSADPDLDLAPNGLEFLLGSNPTVADANSHWGWAWDDISLTWNLWWKQLERDLKSRIGIQISTAQDSALFEWRDYSEAALKIVDTGFGSTLNRISIPADSQQNTTIAFRLEAKLEENQNASDEPKWTWFEAEGSAGGESHPALSNGRMIWQAPGDLIRKTNIQIPSDGVYTLWIRKFWTGYPIQWRLNGLPWLDVDASAPIQDLRELDEPSRRVGWIQAGQVEITQGRYTFELKVTNNSWAAFDTFLLTRESFIPRGEARPGDIVNTPPEGWSAFLPENDPFTFSPIDLSYMNQETAGEDGFIAAHGDKMVFSDTGKPVRFWGVNVSSTHSDLDPVTLSYLARSLAKRGVNLVRFHSPIFQTSGNIGLLEPDLERIQKVQRLIQIFSREGIYTGLSIYFPLHVNIPPGHTEFPGYTNNAPHPFGLPYFNPLFQDKLRSIWRAALTTPSTESDGQTLAKNPAVAYLEMINEDSLFFWTTDSIPLEQRRILEERFGSWIIEQYGSIATRTRQWNSSHSRDNSSDGRLGIRSTWELFNNRDLRSQDTVKFFSEIQRQYYDSTRNFLKQELGYQGMVCGSNWKTGSPKYLDPIEQWTNAGGDFLDQHGYFNGLHSGLNASWSVMQGQSYDDRSALNMLSADGNSRDTSNPLMNPQYAGKPSMISELNWPTPNRHRGEMPLLGAVYASLQGTDALGWFALASSPWETLPSKFSLSTPGILGQFPAAALIYRNQWVTESDRVVDIDLSLNALWRLEGGPIPAPQNFDQLRGDDIPQGGTIPNADAIDELAFWVGKTHADFVLLGESVDSKILDLGSRIRRDEKKVYSLNDELQWDWDSGRVTVQTSHAEGWIGSLSGAQELASVSGDLEFEFGAVILVSMDGKPLSEAERLAIQVFSEEMPYGWTTEPADATGQLRTIISTGESPLLIRNTPGSIQWKRSDAQEYQFTYLDWNGYRMTPPVPVIGPIPLPTAGGYIWIERK